ncbi:MAG TPA: serine/threonine-protein kinase [Kofleriaceae bacterium]|nr:serine/threonine-protein kinase [Kofleriaceae bacterium]
MPDLLAIVSKAIFERDAPDLVPGDVWPVDRYTSSNKALQALAAGGRIFLVTVRPPDERLWLIGRIDAPVFDGTAWVGTPNTLPATDITALRGSIKFESGKGIMQERGTLGMSLQMPRALARADVEQILATVAAASLGDSAKDATVAASPRPATPPPRVIGGKYRVVRELGRGGMGVVYEALHTATGRRVAVKEIAIGNDPRLVERFEREARATGAIDSRHVPPVLDAGSEPGTANPFLVMELLDGVDFQAYLDEYGPLSEDVALRIVAQACAGLVRAHAAGVVHRDIKPANLFLARREGELVVQLLDFGVARVKEELASKHNPTLTVTGVMLGTPLYMSPEQVVSGAKELDARTDLWSLAIVLYEALAGQTPHAECETLGGLMVAICGKPAKPVRELAPKVSEPVEAIVMKALALDPAQRYPTAEALLEALEAQLPFGTKLERSLLD